MRRPCACLGSAILLAGVCEAGDVQLFNTQVLGQPTSNAVRLLTDKLPGDAEPFVVWSDIADGEYSGASVYYRKPVTFDIVRAALNRAYSRFEMPDPSSGAAAKVPFAAERPLMALWRVTDPKMLPPGRPLLVIQLTMADEESVRVIYLAGGGSRLVTPGAK